MANKVFIATSLDGYIAEKDGGIGWLDSVPNPDQSDLGYFEFIASVDALIMGRVTFEKVCGFDCDWPYEKPVFVLSKTQSQMTDGYKSKAEFINGSISDVIEKLNSRGFKNFYIDGGKTIQSFLELDLIDDLIITKIPILLGGGIPLFGEHSNSLLFELSKTEVMLDALVQSHYKRIKTN